MESYDLRAFRRRLAFRRSGGVSGQGPAVTFQQSNMPGRFGRGLDTRSRDAPAPVDTGRGAIIISLDLEMHWGMRDSVAADGPYRGNLLGAREAVPRLLDLFEQFGIAATWATVGFLFARSRRELERFSPALRPAYEDPRMDPYAQPLGETEETDPLHFGASLVEAIARTPRQELATHTFSHYYCLERGQSRATFRADLESAVALAAERGIVLRSIVFPRNQHNPEYDSVLAELGITCYRGNQPGWMYRGARRERPWRRVARLLDSHLGVTGAGVFSWASVVQPNGLCNVPASTFFRPFSPLQRRTSSLRLTRVTRSIELAARSGGIFHLWWHPHNFGTHLEENLARATQVLKCFARCREIYGMQSCSMIEIADAARSREHAKISG